MNKKISIRLKEKEGRIDKVLNKYFPEYTRSKIQIWIKNELITVNDKVIKPSYMVKNGDQIVFNIPKKNSIDLKPQDIPLEIVYQDEYVAVINKPQGMVVHPSIGHRKNTLVNALLYHLKSLSSFNKITRPGIVHRIDKDTSGLLMVAKNDTAHKLLSDQLKNKVCLRKYLAIVHGNIPHNKGIITAPIGRSKINRHMKAVVQDGKYAITNFFVLERYKNFSLIQLKLETGRTHQIRVHMKYIGFPIAGDPLYGPVKTLKGKGQFLHAISLSFFHPKTNVELAFEVPVPKIFKETLEKLKKS